MSQTSALQTDPEDLLHHILWQKLQGMRHISMIFPLQPISAGMLLNALVSCFLGPHEVSLSPVVCQTSQHAVC